MLRFQDPGSIFRPLRAERTLRGAHCLEGKTEAQRRVWLAQSHVVVARKGTVFNVCLPDSKIVFGQQGPGPGWETSVPSALPFLLPIQMPAPGYSHLFSREVGGWPPGGQSSWDGGHGWPWAAQLSGSRPSMWRAVWMAVLATFPEHAPRKTRNVSWMTQSPSQVTHSCGRAVRRGLGCLKKQGSAETRSLVCRRGSLGHVHSQGQSVPGGGAMGRQLPSCPCRQPVDSSLVTELMPQFWVLPPALSWSCPCPHGDNWYDPAHECPPS